MHSSFITIIRTAMRSQRGAATLPTIIAMTILILAIGVSITAISFTESLISIGQENTAQALMYADAGARDALIKLTRNKNYTCVSTNCYSISFAPNGCTTDDGCARIRVSAGAGTIGDPRIIVSEGKVKSSVRTIQASVIFDTALNGEIATTTWSEL